jgi:hypothetical protein
VRDLVYPASAIDLYFMYHVIALSLKVVSSCVILDSSSVTLFVDHISSHMNQCCFATSVPTPLNASILRVESWFSILDIELCLLDCLLIVVDTDALSCEVLPTLASTSLYLLLPFLLISLLLLL